MPAYRPGVCAAWRSALSSCSKHRRAPQLLTVPQPANPSRTLGNSSPHLGSRGQGWNPSPEACSRQTPRGAELQVGVPRSSGPDPHCPLLASGPNSLNGGPARVYDRSPACSQGVTRRSLAPAPSPHQQPPSWGFFQPRGPPCPLARVDLLASAIRLLRPPP